MHNKKEIHQSLSNVAKCQKQNSLYLMHVMLSNREVIVINKDASIELWHERLQHVHQKGRIYSMRRHVCTQRLVLSVWLIKKHKVTFQYLTSERKSYPLELAYVGLCYMKDRIVGSALYFPTYINYFSQSSLWVFMEVLKQKLDGSLSTFQQIWSFS